MGSFYQPIAYLSGGKSKRSKRSKRTKKTSKKTRQNGGFYPSVMGGVMRAGTYLLPMAFKHGVQLFNGKTKKGKSKKHSSKKTMRKK